ncbi:MAG: transporter substrate-binding domain-containing protein [Arcobacter sp.]|jgi:polar amino acid transport system substrate-binding protein/two-component system sensor histidine kinase EvgS|uniref:transporter substrate-binding domain-containing protein n=1 Tax=Arcobacter sp. TaxID=1872629 RepID=UPI002A75DBED|nr:transporter substrate-binding domain-containing protein [Arcobacter sp.]MDY3199974.1 transporter substrate-binding domain-containing protein [Arcobacter sp.]
MKYITFLLLFVSVLFCNVERDNNLIFTKEELTWIKNNPKIKVGVDANWPPFDYIDITGQHQGVSSEYLNLITKYTGLRFDIYSDAWINVLDKIQKKELDLLACAAKTSQRESYLNFTDSYLDVEIVVVGRKDLKLNTFDEIKNYKVAVQKNNYIYEDLSRMFPNMKFYFVKSNEEAFKAISYGKADFYLGNLAVVTYFIEKDLLTNLEIKMKSDFESAKLSIAVLKENKILFDIIQKVLDSISEEEKDKINKKWILENESKERLINFSKEELDWLKQNPIIYLSGDPKWPPFSFYEDGKYVGIIPDMLNLLKEVSGINFSHLDTNSWQDSVNLLKNKEIKILDAVTITPSMSKILDFTSKYFSSQIVIIGNKKNERYISSIKDLENIKNKTLGLVEGHFITEMIKRDNPDLEIFGTFKDIPEGLKALSTGMIDYFILDIPTFDYYSKIYSLSNLKIVGITGYNTEYRFGVEKDNIILVSIMNKILKHIPQDRKDEIYRKWIKIDSGKNIDYDLIWKISVISFIILSIIFYWNRKLKQEIKEKEKIQKELEKERNNINSLNEELKKAKDVAENIARQKSEFLANMSHEIRTPMNSVIGFTEILDKEIQNPLHKEYLSSIKKGGDSLLRIINDILDLSKIEAGKLEIKQESINPTNMFLEIESIFHSKIMSKNITFIVEIDKTIPKYIIMDGVRIRQILFNLIGNAIKFTEKGHIKLKVENVYKDNIKSKIDLIFSVEDTGIGIDENNLKSIFNAFEQVKNQDVAKYGGTGLGLAICAKLVHMMNGEIEVQSEKNKGSIFRVILRDIPVSSMEEEIISNKLSASNIAFEKAQILVVDDVEENRKLVQASLKDYDIDLIMANNGQEALNKLKNISVDLILMDLRMPVMDGYEAAMIIKNDERLKNTPLIALTASVMGKDLERVSKYGFDGYLRKPVILDDLIEELGKYLKYYFVNEDFLEKDIYKVIDIKKLQEVIEKLENELRDEWKEIKDGGDFSLIEEFAQKLYDLSIQKDIYLLKDYSSELLKNIEAFDIEKVDYLMNTYIELIDNLKVKLENGK